MSNLNKLQNLENEMINDSSLPLTAEANLVFGEGNPRVKVMFIGEAPGRDEDIQKRPFVGRGGQLLRKNIRAIGWNEEDVYITNIVKRRPPGNRDPMPEEIVGYKPYLKRQIKIISPPVVVTLGRFATNYFLSNAKITRDQGKIFRMRNKCIIPMLHPAAALRGTGNMEAFTNTFKKLPKMVEKCETLLKKTLPEKNKEAEQERLL